jgi:hypothetical protein
MSWWLLLVALVLSLGYRGWRYASIRRAGHEVQWSVPLVRWAKRLRSDDRHPEGTDQ